MGFKQTMSKFWSDTKAWTYKYVGGLVMEEKKDGTLAISLGRVSFVAVLCWMMAYWNSWDPAIVPEGTELVTLPPGLLEVFYTLAAYIFGTKLSTAIKAKFT